MTPAEDRTSEPFRAEPQAVALTVRETIQWLCTNLAPWKKEANEPEGLRWVRIVGLLLLVSFFPWSLCIAPDEIPTWRSEESAARASERTARQNCDQSIDQKSKTMALADCAMQLRAREESSQGIDLEIERAKRRKAGLESSLSGAGTLTYRRLLDGIDWEKEELKRLDRKKRSLSSIGKGVGWTLFLLATAIGVLLIAFGRLAARHAASFQRNVPTPLTGWLRVYLIIAGGAFLVHFAQEITTSVIPIGDKAGFGWNSYCVSRRSWWLLRFAMLGDFMVIAYPLSWLFCVADHTSVPRLELTDPSGDCGLGGYVRFLRIWCAVACFGFVGCLLPTFALFAGPFEGENAARYLPTPLFGVLVMLCLVGAMVRKAYQIRFRYYEARHQAGATWKEVEDAKFAPDPTLDFLGDKWWRLPAAVFLAAAVAWKGLEWIGISDDLMRALHVPP